MSIRVRTIQPADTQAWDAYVYAHTQSTLYHLSGWKNIIEKTYGHKTYYLMAIESDTEKPESLPQACPVKGLPRGISAVRRNPLRGIPQGEAYFTGAQRSSNEVVLKPPANEVAGILPLVHLKHFLFGNSLISIPFFDLGGILSDDNETEKTLLSEAIKLGQDLKVKNMELRHIYPVKFFEKDSEADLTGVYPVKPESHLTGAINPINFATRSHKVRMLLSLPESSEVLMKCFKAKLRSQIKKPIKEGLKSKIGGLELLEDFYQVFVVNMRDLGSPVHSKKLMKNVLEEFPEKARIVVTYKEGQPLACSLVVGFKGTLENPWASALREYSRLSPNMHLYWTMLEYACDNGYAYFDFGRSSPDEGTYKFKEQWGAKPTTLHWHYISLDSQPINEDTSEKSRFDKAIQYWQKLPVPVTKILGPSIRKHIGL